jgi:tRNA1Val (adenine37-N6)-methyltransferase
MKDQSTGDDTHAGAAARFPRGLAQPERGYRFSLDSLLLARFILPPAGRSGLPVHGLDLGTGCGVVALALLLDHHLLAMTGVERQPELHACAVENRALFGFEGRFNVALDDVAAFARAPGVAQESYDFAVANPPYRRRGSGRTCPDPVREGARFEDEDGLEPFTLAAARLLKQGAPLALVHLPERLPGVLAACASAGLEPKRLRFVHSRADKPARMLLLEARKGGGPGLAVEPPLVLYAGAGPETRLSPQALAFCPHLRCNARQGGTAHARQDP